MAKSTKSEQPVSVRRRVLIIDDDHDILDLLEIILYQHFEVATALNGFEALKIAGLFKPDLILTDIMMPVMDGIKLLNTLKKQPETAAIPVIAATAFIKEHSVKSLLNLGFAAVVSKPFERNTVITLIREKLSPHENRA
ncbi:MAG: response regulator [Chitinivibrionales bacterium]|nr:response regulator [Chitinivibrionales bacterium]